jgi:hypothetical protein
MKIFLTVTAFLFATGSTFADDAATQKLKAAATAALEKAAVKNVQSAETEHLLVFANVPSAKIKALADLAEKTFVFTAKSLKVEKTDELFAGKLPVFVISDRKSFTALIQALENRRPEQDETYEIKTRGDVPFVAVGVGIGSIPNDAELATQTAQWTAAAVLNKKLGTDPGAFDLPEWAQLGFGKIAALRAEGNPVKVAAYRTKARSLVNGRVRGVVKITDACSGTKGREHDLLVMSVVDYLAFGPDPEKFTQLMTGFKKSDTNQNPTMDSIVRGLEWKWEDLDIGWKTMMIKAK